MHSCTEADLRARSAPGPHVSLCTVTAEDPHPVVRSLRVDRKSSCVGRSKMCCRLSMARMNKHGDRGSPYVRSRMCLIHGPFTPLSRLCLIHGPFTPLSRTEDEEEESSSASQLCHLVGKPRYSRSSRRYIPRKPNQKLL
jgi:hypothetical protein